MLAEIGNADDAGAFLDFICADDDVSGIPHDNAWAACLTLVGDASFLIDSPVHTAPIYDWLLPFEDRFAAVGQAECFGSIARILGQAAATCGRLDDAVLHFERGIAADQGTGGVRMMVRGQWGLARTLLARDASGDAALAATDHRRHAGDGGPPRAGEPGRAAARARR